MVAEELHARAAAIVGDRFVTRDPDALLYYGTDAVQRPHLPDLVVQPGSATEVCAIARLCTETRTPLVPRGAGTGYSGGAVPARGGVVVSLERLNRILEIDPVNLLARVQPHVVTGDLQDAVEAQGLFFPPDPASLRRSVIGGNIAECAGGPRAFKYGTVKRYVLGLEVVLPSGEIIRTGSKAVKNVVGYDLTQLIVGSEGTLGIVTEATLRLVPRPATAATLRATFDSIEAAVGTVNRLIDARVVPASVELIDGECLEAVQRHVGRALAPEGTGALLLIEVDGFEGGVREEVALVERACVTGGCRELLRAEGPESQAEREELWQIRRELSPALREISPIKRNHDVVVPRGRVPELFALVGRLKQVHRLQIPCFGHAGDGNIHVNMLLDPDDEEAPARADAAERELFVGVVALEGSISGEHGIGLTKQPFITLELSAQEIALMKRIKAAFDPAGILNPGKIFP